MKKSLLVSLVILSLSILSFIGNATFAMQYDTLYASDRNYLFTINSATGIGTPVAPISGFTQLIDIAFLGRQLYANGYTGAIDLGHFNLFQMNPDTGATTLIGSPGYIFAGMAGGPDGYLYGAYKDFYKVDPSTGVATLIGSLGNNLTIAGDIAFGPNGVLYASFDRPYNTLSDGLGAIDINTGSATLVGPIGFDGVVNLSFKDGVLYGGDRSGQLLTIVTSTGQGTLVGTDTHVYLGGMTTSPVPEPSTMLLLGSGLIGLAGYGRKKFRGK
jgi:hypothetical protein